MTNAKYLPVAIWVLLAIGVFILAGTEIVWFALTACVGFIIALFPAEQRTRAVMKKEAKAEILKYESPISWLKISLLFSCISIITGILYAVIHDVDIGINITAMGNYILSATLFFFGISLMYLVRVTWFVFDPKSKNNLLTSKASLSLSKYGPIGVIIVFMAVVQLTNTVFLLDIVETALSGGLKIVGYVYLVTIFLSYTAIIPLGKIFVFHFNDYIDRKGALLFFIFMLPWIFLGTIGLLEIMNVTLI